MNEKGKNIIKKSNLNAGRDIHVGDKIVNIYNTQEDANETSFSKQNTLQVRDLIGKNKIKKSLELLLKYTKVADDDLYNQMVQQSQRWNQLQKNLLLGLISNEDASIISARIVMALLNIVNELEELNPSSK